MTAEIRFHRITTVLLTAALLATLTVALTGGQRAEAVDGPVDLVYVATGRNFPDALAGANLAATVGAPMLTVEPDLPIPDATVTALQALDPDRIIILGGPGAVSDAVRGALADYARSGSVTRIEGLDRHATAAAIADALPDKVHDADKLDGLDSSNFARTDHTHDDLLGSDEVATDSERLDGIPAAVYRAWPLQFTRAFDGAVMDNLGGPSLPNSGSPNLTAYYSVPPTHDAALSNTLTLALHDFAPTGCTVRLRVWGPGAGAVQYHHVNITAGPGVDGWASLDIPWGGLGTLPGSYVHIERDAENAADTCSHVNVTGLHLILGTS